MSETDVKLSIRNVCKRYEGEERSVLALEHVSIEVRTGEFLMLVGPSGCGKSTLLSMIAGLTRPDEGEILIDGRPVRGPGPDRGVVFQDGALFPWLTVRKNVEFGLRQAGMRPRERTERAREYLAKVGLSKFENASLHELSGGMRQRVAIARCLVLEPEVVLMDEPFSALDAITREDLYTQLQEIWSDRSTTVVFVTHNGREAVTLGDRVVLMSPHPGRVQEVFPIDILRPRQIDDVDVTTRAHQISLAMKRGPQPPSDEPSQESRLLRPADRTLGAGR